MELKTTPLNSRHLIARGRMVDFAGFSMPVEYGSVLKEAVAVRTTCGLFDASHMGEIRVQGSKAVLFLQKMLSNDLDNIKANQLQYNLLMNQQGGVIDDLMVYRFLDGFWCVVNAVNKNAVLQWLRAHQEEDVVITDESDEVALMALQGPQSAKIISELFSNDLDWLPYMFFSSGKWKGKKYTISRSGYTGEDGFELYVAADDAGLFWDAIVNCGKDKGLSLCGLGSRDILRIEAGYPLYGHELSAEINPYEASVSWAVKLHKETFIGKDELLKLKNSGIKSKRVGLVMENRAVPRQGYKVYAESKQVGVISSGTYSPNLDKFIAMAFIDREWSSEDTHLEIDVRGRRYQACVTRIPFVPVHTKKNCLTDNCGSSKVV